MASSPIIPFPLLMPEPVAHVSNPPTPILSDDSGSTASSAPVSYESASTDNYKWSQWNHWKDFHGETLSHFQTCYHDTRIMLPHGYHKVDHDGPVWTDCVQGLNLVIARGLSVIINRTLKQTCEKLDIPRCYFTTGLTDKKTGTTSPPDWAGTTSKEVETRRVAVPCIIRMPPDHLESALDALEQNPDAASKPWVYADPVFKYIGRCVYDLWLIAKAWNTRYGYIMTGTEVIVVRFSHPLLDLPSTHPDYGLPPYEIAIIPQTGFREEDKMTSVHAIVMIHVLASLKNDIRAEYLPIDEDPDYKCLMVPIKRMHSDSEISLIDINF